MSARTPERRNKQSTCCLLAEILFSRGLRGTRGCAQVSRACHAGGACSPLTGRRADIKWPLHLAECLCNEILRMVPRLPRSLREIQICLCEIKNCVLKFGVLNHGLKGQRAPSPGQATQEQRPGLDMVCTLRQWTLPEHLSLAEQTKLCSKLSIRRIFVYLHLLYM